MQRIYSLIVLSILLITGVSACSGSKSADPATTVEDIESLIYSGDFEAARSLADELCNDTTLTLSTRQLCQLSIAYMKFSDIFDTDINTALATRCYRMAINSDAEAANAYYETLPLDESRHVDLMSKLEPLLSADRDTYIDEGTDIDPEYLTPECSGDELP
ncbi:MAG: hypothetical protein K2I64_01420 [Muribaculaceae bacterium]|nr:hypothetical protein [Muribaculaceae bacterium]